MSTITATSGQPIRVGRKLDNKAVSVTFDLTALCTEYSPEEVKLAVKRDGDDMAYYAPGWTMDGSTGTWIPTSVDLARHACYVQPILFAADDVAVHGEIFRCVIGRSIDDETKDIPAAQSLLIEIGRVSDKADTAISTAAQAASDVSTATSIAQTATEAAQTAQSNASTALETAQSASSAAQSAQSTASTALETAQSASSAAQSAQSTASTALETAQSASSAAQTAQNTASTASSTASQAAEDLTALDGRVSTVENKFINPNITLLPEISIDYGSNNGKISYAYSRFANVEQGKQYVVSADIAKTLTGDLEGRITSSDGTVTQNVFMIPSRSSPARGRGRLSFVAPATGKLWINANLGSTWKSYEVVLAKLQIEEGSSMTDYVPAGLSPLVDGVCRSDLSELSATLKKGIGRYFNDVITCASVNGYTDLGDDPASLEAMTAAKKRGFDLVEIALYNSDGHLYVAHANKTISDITLESAVRHCSKIGIGMCVALGYGDPWNENICAHLSKVFRIHRIPHVYAQNGGTGMLGYIREVEPTAEIVAFFSSGFPTLSDLTTSAAYEELRTLATQNALTSICVKSANGTVDDAYADGCADLGLGLVAGPDETTAALQSKIQYYNMIVGQKRTCDIFTVIS